MTAAEAAASRAFVLEVTRAAKVRKRAVERVLAGLEVWPRTYARVAAILRDRGVDEIPPPGPRADRWRPPKPCPACAAKDAELEVLTIGRDLDRAELAKVRADYQQALVVATEFREECHRMEDKYDAAVDECERLRARVAELEAVTPEPEQPLPTGLIAGTMEVVGRGPDLTPERLVAMAVPPQPDETTRALAKAVGRTCTVRIQAEDGTLVRASELAAPPLQNVGG